MENPAPHFRYYEEIIGAEYGSLGIRWKKDPEVFKRFFGFEPDDLQEEYDTAKYILLESEFTRDTFLSQGLPGEKLLVIPPGVDTVRLRPPESPRPKRPFRVVFVGALGVRKGVQYLLDAWSELSLRDAELVLVGTIRDDIRPLLERWRGVGGIRFVGFVRDLLRLYQEGSVFVFPSLSEGSAKVTHEAMACGLPVIVTPNAGSVARDREDGFLIPPRDLEALKEKLLKLYEDQEMRERMGQNARRHIEAFTWDAHRKHLLAIYEAVYAGGPFGTGAFPGAASGAEGDSG
jgi:glycosyltransferase involved in cell wall biosynthesis